MPQAVKTVSSRFGVKPWSPHELFVLFSIYYLPTDINQSAIIRHAKRMGYPIGQSSVSEALTLFKAYELVDVVGGRYCISAFGREYLSALRRYLINKRL